MSAVAEEQDTLAQEDHQDPQLAAGEDAGNGGDEAQDDIELLLTDPAAFEKANKALVEKAQVEPQEDAPEPKQSPAAPAEDPKDQAADPDPVVEVITYRGQPLQVRKSQMKDLMQKGRHLEVVLEELTPLRVISDDRELMTLARKIQRLPKGKDALKEALRSAFENALPEVDGYTREEVAGASRLLRPLLEAEGLAGAPAPVDEPPGDPAQAGGELSREEQIEVRAHIRAALAMEPSPEEAAKTLELVNRAILEADEAAPRGQLKDSQGNVIPLEAWQRIRADLNDPRRPEAFLRFFRDMGERRRAAAAQANKPKVVVKAGSLPAGGNRDRLGAGAAAEGGKAGGRSAWDLSEEEFEKTLRSL